MMWHFSTGHTPPCGILGKGLFYIRGWGILYILLVTPNIMKLFVAKFYQTLILNVATIAAIVVGIVQFGIRAYKENNGAEKTRKVIQTVLQFIDTIVSQLLPLLDTDVPVVKVAQKTTKRRWLVVFYFHTWEIQMRTTHRFVTFKEALVFLMNELQLSNQEATHFIWDNQFTMGTDRAIWITMPIWELAQDP